VHNALTVYILSIYCMMLTISKILTKISNREFLTSADFVGDSFVFYDLKLQKRNKQDILKLTQYWKNFIRCKKATSLLLVDYLTPDSLAIFLACLETGTELLTSPNNKQKILDLSKQVDVVLIGEIMSDRAYVDDHKYIKYLYTDLLLSDEYSPDFIDWDKILISGYTSGTTGVPKKITHTPTSFLSASVLASQFFSAADRYATYPNFNHLGVVSMHVMGPVIAGVVLFSITGNLDLISLISRKILNKITFFDINLKELMTHFPTHNVDLSNVELYCGGSSPTTTFVDWFFDNKGKKIYTFFGASECLPPVFYNEIINKDHIVLDRDLGQLIEPHQIDKNNNDQLLIKGPSIATSVKLDDWGFYNTGDYVSIDNNTVKYLGRQSSVHQQKIVYHVDVENVVTTFIADLGLMLPPYLIEFEKDTIKILLPSTKVHPVLAELAAVLADKFAGFQIDIMPIWPDESVFKITPDRSKMT
jgi:AMP-binding enzyme